MVSGVYGSVNHHPSRPHPLADPHPRAREWPPDLWEPGDPAVPRQSSSRWEEPLRLLFYGTSRKRIPSEPLHTHSERRAIPVFRERRRAPATGPTVPQTLILLVFENGRPGDGNSRALKRGVDSTSHDASWVSQVAQALQGTDRRFQAVARVKSASAPTDGSRSSAHDFPIVSGM